MPSPETIQYFTVLTVGTENYILDMHGNKIKTHRSNPMRALDAASATLLVDDLNSVYNSDFLKDLRSSFCYCALSTFQERSGASEEREWDIN
jgi:hypothetical protein